MYNLHSHSMQMSHSNIVSWTCFLKIVVVSAFMKRSVEFLLDWIYLISMWLSFISSWVYEKNLGGICLLLSLLIYHSLNCEMHAALFSYKIIGLLLTEKPQDSSIWCVIDLIHTHSLLASCSAIISEWFEEVATSVYFWERQEIAVPLFVNT